MTHVPNELAEEFPDHLDTIHKLKTTSTHFSRLFDAYHELNRKFHRAETGSEPTTDDRMTDLRRRRLTIKDEVYALLKLA